MRRTALLLLLPLALLAAACGGSSSSATGTGTESSAEITPASAVAFVSIATDEDSEQWKQAAELLSKFPIRERVLTGIKDQLSGEGVDFDRDVRPAIGPTLEFTGVQAADGDTKLVGMTQPADEEKFLALLDKADEGNVHAEIDGWTVFSDEQAALDAFRADGDKLADSEAFADAMAELPEDANVKAYLSGTDAVGALGREVPELRSVPEGTFEWVSLALSSHADGWKIDGAAKSDEGAPPPLDRELLERVPSGALVAVAFNGSRTSALDQLRKNPSLSQQSAQLEQLLGVSLEDVVGLLRGDSVLYVRQGAPIPEVTLVTEPEDPDRALRTVDDAVARIVGFVGSPPPTRTQIGGVAVRRIELDEVSVSYGLRDGALIASTGTAAFGDSSGPSLEDDPVFSDAADAADFPDDATALVYVNIRDAVPLLEGFARASGDPLPREAVANLDPLESFLGFSTADGEIAHFSSLLQVS